MYDRGLAPAGPVPVPLTHGDSRRPEGRQSPRLMRPYSRNGESRRAGVGRVRMFSLFEPPAHEPENVCDLPGSGFPAFDNLFVIALLARYQARKAASQPIRHRCSSPRRPMGILSQRVRRLSRSESLIKARSTC
jgi:hypothetical protein